MLSAEGQVFGVGEKSGHLRRKGRGSPEKYLKKYFGGSEKILTFAAPQEGERTGGARPRGMR